MIWFIFSGTQLKREFEKALDVISDSYQFIIPGVYGYEFFENWMR